MKSNFNCLALRVIDNLRIDVLAGTANRKARLAASARPQRGPPRRRRLGRGTAARHRGQALRRPGGAAPLRQPVGQPHRQPSELVRTEPNHLVRRRHDLDGGITGKGFALGGVHAVIESSLSRKPADLLVRFVLPPDNGHR